MRRTFKIAAAVFAAAIMLALTGCTTEHLCEFCGQSFSSGGSVSVTNDGREIALCSDCMSRLEKFIMIEYDK